VPASPPLHSITLPLAFGFGNLAMLGWLAAAAAPLIIHLWMRHTHRELPWAAMRFLQAAILKHARRLQFQQWLLLAIRTAILALIVLAAAKPFWTGWGGAATSARTHRLLVIDTSFSMGYQTGDGTRFAEAQKLARELIDANHPGDIYSLCTLANPPQVILGRAVADRERIVAAIGNLEATQGTADLSATLRSVDDLLARVEADATEINRHEIVFISDLGRNTWDVAARNDTTNQGLLSPDRNAPSPEDGEGGSVGAAPQAAGVEAILKELGERANLSAVDVGAGDTANLAVTDIRLPRDVVTTAAPVEIVAEVKNFSRAARDGLVAELLIDGLPTAETAIDVAGGGAATANFAYQFPDAGPRAVEVRIGADRLPIDDRRYLAVDVQFRARVLCVAGTPGAARYVAEALNPGLAESAPVQPRIVSESAFSEIPLDDFDCVFFCNVAQFSESERDRIDRYLQLGGGVVWFLGDRVLPEQYNAVHGEGGVSRPAGEDRADLPPPKPQFRLASFAQDTDNATPNQVALLPAVLGPIVTTPSYGLDPLGYKSPIVAPFRGRERAGLLTTPVSRYFLLEPRRDSEAETALATLNGNPFIVTAPVHRGRVVLVATAASMESVERATGEPWTAMPAWPSFLPLVREMFHFSSAGFRREASHVVGQMASGVLADRLNTRLEVRLPNGKTAELSDELSAAGNHWRFSATDAAGVYRVAPVGSEQTVASFAVNVNPRESELTRVDAALLPGELAIHTGSADEVAGNAQLAIGTRLNRVLLTVVLGLLLAETLLAWRFGRGAA
jgi:hypothetical protein